MAEGLHGWSRGGHAGCASVTEVVSGLDQGWAGTRAALRCELVSLAMGGWGSLYCHQPPPGPMCGLHSVWSACGRSHAPGQVAVSFREVEQV